MRGGPRLYNLFPSAVGPVSAWVAELPRIAAMGFDWVYVNPFHYPGFSGSLYAVKDYHRLNPLFDDGAPAELQLGRFTAAARAEGLAVMMDLVVNHTARDALLVSEHHEWYARAADGALISPAAIDPDDPTRRIEWGDLAQLDYGNPAHHPDMVAHWRRLVEDYVRLGFTGFRCDAAYQVPAAVWAGIIGGVRGAAPQAIFAAETLGCDTAAIAALHQAGFDLLFNSAKWWDFHAPWLLEQYDLLRAIAPSIAFPESHDTPRLSAEIEGRGDVEAWYRLRAAFAAFFSAGWMMPIGYEWGWSRKLDVVNTRPGDREPPRFDLSPFLAALNRLKAGTPVLNDEGPQMRLTRPGQPVVALLRRSRTGGEAALLVMNTDPLAGHGADPAGLLAAAGLMPGDLADCTPLAGLGGPPSAGGLHLDPLGFRLYRTPPAGDAAAVAGGVRARRGDAAGSGILILAVEPCVDCGRWPVKREEGDVLEVTADILRHGHDRLAARVLYRAAGAEAWDDVPMQPQDNDRWLGRVTLPRPGRVEYRVEAWVDAYESWRDDLGKKRAAGQDVAVEIEEGRRLVAAALARVGAADRERLERALAEPATLDGPEVAAVMARWPDRGTAIRSDRVLEVVVERARARFGAWYGMVARSQGTEPGCSASLRDCERRLPDIARMGFDVVYLLPIHPIGRVHRKGADNALVAAPGEPGSPYAIGSVEGGHDAVHPDLGTLADFRHFVAAASRLGMEVALDFAIQCAPDHPWVREHPDWFSWRPDGTIRYAENPPKKYQDIVNLDFQSPDAPAIWRELLDVVLFWRDQGVRIFRVDNPHTKPVPFWEWLIRSVQERDPGVIFLSEAFTRPKMMRALAKAGFSQSYTYFTWRNFKREIAAYVEELAHGEARDYLRPNFWPSTPDILPPFLQTGGRAAFRIRLVLAATLSASWGMYNGYELCEAEAVPGREEYLHSEKYQYKLRDWNLPGNIKDEVARLNAIRRDNPALHETENLRFHPAEDDSVLFYGKATLDRSNLIFVAVTLDPFDAHDAVLHFPLADMGVAEGETYEMEDLLTGRRHLWRGAVQRLRLDPAVNPAAIFRVTVWASVDYRTPCL